MDYAKFLIDDNYSVDYVIYRFKNNVNGKVYIGQTTKSLHKRVIQHLTNSRPTTKAHKTYFHNALNKYGIENFSLDIIERCSSQEELNEREIYWIAYYKSTDKKYGYNIDSGGNLGKSTSKLSKEHRQALLAANLGKQRSKTTKQRLKQVHKQLWEDPEFKAKHIGNILKVAGINKKPVYQYSLDGEFIKEWQCISDVQEALYGNKRNGNMTRNIINSNNKNMLGFMKNMSIWSFTSPAERRAYQRT